ncbi:hypothetical protein [Streptomyces sp. NBC_00057]|uniref:hypothetical protein n=1 Tax=Streptomyces sp. NBC_00057 TaxID=2975634 RepID=UPI003868923C
MGERGAVRLRWVKPREDDRRSWPVLTVKTYIGRLLSKLRARDRAQLVISAYESGLVSAAHQSTD